jgi:hypothetical protein
VDKPKVYKANDSATEMEHYIKTFCDLNDTLMAKYGRRCFRQECSGYVLQRYVIKSGSGGLPGGNLAQVEFELTLPFDDSSKIVTAQVLGNQAYDRFVFSGFPYNQIQHHNKMPAKVELRPFKKCWHGCGEKKGQYSFKLDDSARFLRFLSEPEVTRSTFGTFIGLSPEGLFKAIDAIHLAQRIHFKLESQLREKAQAIFDGL